MAPLVSFLVAAYNEETHILDCVNSCLGQDYSDIEVCVVDDGSIDRTAELCKEHFSQLPNFKFFKFDQNLGKAAAFNKAFELSSGTYVAIMGADDVNPVDRISRSLQAIRGHVLVFGDMNTIVDGVTVESGFMARFGLDQPAEISFKRLLFSPCVYGGTMLIDRYVASQVFPLPSNLAHEDWFIPLKASRLGSVFYTNKVLYSYRQHAGQTSRSSRFFDFKSFYKWLNYMSRDLPYYKHILNEFDLDSDSLAYVNSKTAFLSSLSGENFLQRRRLLIEELRSKPQNASRILVLGLLVGRRFVYYAKCIKHVAAILLPREMIE